MHHRPNTHRRPNARALTSLLVVGLLAIGLVAAQSADEPSEWTYVLERTTTAASHFDVNVSVAGGTGESAFIAILGLDETTQPMGLVPVTMLHRTGELTPSVHALGERVGCPDANCGVLGQVGGSGVSWAYDSTTDVEMTRVLIAVRSFDQPEVTLREAAGWQLVEQPFNYRTVQASEAQSVGVSHPDAGAEVFLSASAAGYPQGSVAMGELPCSPGSVGVPAGLGTGTLRGGIEEPTLTCAVDYEGPVAAVADDETTWSLDADGAAVGRNGTFETRLFVASVPPTPSCEESAYVLCSVQLPGSG